MDIVTKANLKLGSAGARILSRAPVPSQDKKLKAPPWFLRALGAANWGE